MGKWVGHGRRTTVLLVAITMLTAGIGIFSLAAVASHGSCPAPAGHVTIKETGAGFCSVGAAVTAASSGQTILVEPGRYVEAVVLNKPLTLCSTSVAATECDPRPADTTIESAGPVAVYITSGTVRLSGFTLKAADQVVNVTGTPASPISGVVVEGNIVESTGLDVANGISVKDADSTAVRDNVVRTNTRATSTGIDVDSATSPTVTGNLVEHSRIGILVSRSTDGEVSANTVLVSPLNQFAEFTIGVEIVVGSGHSLAGNTYVGPGTGLHVAGSSGAASTDDTWRADARGIILSKTFGDQPAGLVVRGADLSAAAVKLQIEPGVSGVTVDATYNQWGVHTRSAIRATIMDGGFGNTVLIDCFIDADGVTPICPPQPAFTYSPATPKWRQNVQFTDATTSGGRPMTSRAWDFGDGSASTSENPSHSFAASGTYLVTLSVQDAEGYANSTTSLVTVVNNAPIFQPVGDRTVAEGSGLKFFITATDPDGDAMNFGVSGKPPGAGFNGLSNGSAFLVWTPSYTQAGSYPVTFTVTDGDLSSSASMTITVSNTNRLPTAAFNAPAVLRPGQTGTFASTSSDPDGPLASESWSFDDGSVASGTTVLHAFATEAAHTFTLTVLDGDGASVSKSGSVIVDGTAPVTSAVPTGTLAPNGYYTSAVEFTLSATDSGGSGLAATFYRMDGGAQRSYTQSDKPRFTGDGSHTLEYWSADKAGNVEAANLAAFAIDVSAPAVEITNPPDLLDTGIAVQLESATINFTVEATDGGSGIKNVKYFIDGVLVAIDSSAGPYYYVWDHSAASFGRHVFAVRVTDNVGFVAEDSISVLKLDAV